MTYDSSLLPPPPPPPWDGPPAPPAPPAPARKPWYLRKQWWAVGAVVVLLAVAGAAGGASSAEDSTSTGARPAIAEEPETEAPDVTEAPPTTEAPTTTAPPTTVPAGPAVLPMGTPLPFSITGSFDGDVDVTVSVANPRTATEEPGSYGLEPQNGLYVVVDVTAEVTGGDGSYMVNPYNFKLMAADGTVWDPGFSTAWQPSLGSTDLAAGQRATGTVVFDVPPGAEVGGKVQLDDVGANYGEPFAYWQL
jgi:hypothetical protein